MRAVNLVPLESRRGRGAPSRSGGLVYGLMALLGVLCVVGAMYGLATRTVNDRKSTLAQMKSATAEAEAAAQRLAPYTAFSKLAQDREATVTAVTDNRFAWGTALREIARVTPADVELLELVGGREATTTTTVSQQPPQFELSGCARSQSHLSRLMARLRAVNQVTRVKLSSSAKLETSPNGTVDSSGGDVGDCRTRASDTKFSIMVFFNAKGASPSAAAPTSAPADPKVQTPAATPDAAASVPPTTPTTDPAASAAQTATPPGTQVPTATPSTLPGS